MVIYGYLLVIFWLSLVSIDLLGLVIYGYLWLSYGYLSANSIFCSRNNPIFWRLVQGHKFSWLVIWTRPSSFCSHVWR